MIQKKIQYSHTDVIEEDSIFTYWCYRIRFGRWFSIHILIWQKMIQYSHTDVTKEGLVFKRWLSIHILTWQKMIRHLHTDAIEDDSDDSVFTYWYYKRWSRIWFNTYILIEDDSAHTKDDSVFTYWDCKRWSSWDRWWRCMMMFQNFLWHIEIHQSVVQL